MLSVAIKNSVIFVLTMLLIHKLMRMLLERRNSHDTIEDEYRNPADVQKELLDYVFGHEDK